MKNQILIIFLTLNLFVGAQINCEDANYYLGSAYSHVKKAYDSPNNISDLKYYSNRSLESLKLAKNALNTCDCKKVIDLTNKGIDLLAQVEDAETDEAGRFFMKRARDVCKESLVEIDKCSLGVNITDNNIESKENNAIVTLQNEQLKLKKQQDALKQKEEEIKRQLALQQKKELELNKNTLVLSYKKATAKQIKTYSETLKALGCQYKSIEPNTPFEDGFDVRDVKTHHINYLKALASNYIDQLNTCKQ